jgi:CHASE3 domain sensor protein
MNLTTLFLFICLFVLVIIIWIGSHYNEKQLKKNKKRIKKLEQRIQALEDINSKIGYKK